MAPESGVLDGTLVAMHRFPDYATTANHTEDCREALVALSDRLGWSENNRGFARVAQAGARVLLKPNWVMHENKGPWGMDPLITHPLVIRAAAEAFLECDISTLTIGDAPLQSCDFGALTAHGGLTEWAAALRRKDDRFAGLQDFRRTTASVSAGTTIQQEDVRPAEDFILFDLGRDSYLEPVSHPDTPFRVTQYDPRKLERTHSSGRHQYLVARDVLSADVIVNLPKLKTHKKAGVTCALKNLVGINGNKEFLPHHRIGGSAHGGDCYPGRSHIKRWHEQAMDLVNTVTSPVARRILNIPARALGVLSFSVVDDLGTEGAWSGNDTVWRMCLDLNRIVLYGREDGTIARTPQRRVLHLVDAVVAGQGDGPLAPEPFALGLLLGGAEAAAVDWVGARLLGYDPRKVPIIREAFGHSARPLTPFAPGQVEIATTSDAVRLDELPKPQSYPAGWLDAVAPDRSEPAKGTFFRRWQAPPGEAA